MRNLAIAFFKTTRPTIERIAEFTRFISATVIADSATTASALAIAACVAGPEATRQAFAAWGARAVRMVYVPSCNNSWSEN